jgi:hypothetical protein
VPAAFLAVPAGKMHSSAMYNMPAILQEARIRHVVAEYVASRRQLLLTFSLYILIWLSSHAGPAAARCILLCTCTQMQLTSSVPKVL